LAEEQEDQRFKDTEVAWRKMHPKKVVKRKRCGDFGHFEKTCKLAEIGEDGERAPPRNKACFYPLYGLFLSFI